MEMLDLLASSGQRRPISILQNVPQCNEPVGATAATAICSTQLRLVQIEGIMNIIPHVQLGVSVADHTIFRCSTHKAIVLHSDGHPP